MMNNPLIENEVYELPKYPHTEAVFIAPKDGMYAITKFNTFRLENDQHPVLVDSLYDACCLVTEYLNFIARDFLHPHTELYDYSGKQVYFIRNAQYALVPVFDKDGEWRVFDFVGLNTISFGTYAEAKDALNTLMGVVSRKDDVFVAAPGCSLK